jgi:hypothetical protein
MFGEDHDEVRLIRVEVEADLPVARADHRCPVVVGRPRPGLEALAPDEGTPRGHRCPTLPASVAADSTGPLSRGVEHTAAATRRGRMQNIGTLFANLSAQAVTIGVAVAVFYAIWGGYLIMSSGGSPRQMESGKMAIVHAIVGLVIVLGANWLITMVKAAVPGG